MRLFAELAHRIRGLFRGRRLDAERTEEFRFHVEMEAEKLRTQGLSEPEARRRAAVAFGNAGATLEDVRDVRGTRWLEDGLHDLRYAARQLARSPGFTLVAVVTLALGIGANTAIFSVIDGVLLRPAPLADADRLVVVWETDRGSGTTREPASWPDYLDFQRDSRTLSALAAVSGTDVSLLPQGGDPIRVSGARTTANYFPLIGITPILGRTFSQEEDRPDGPLVVLLSERIWRDRFQADRSVLGASIRLNDQPYQVIGVVPRGADFGLDQIHAQAAYHPPYSGEGEVDVWTTIQGSADRLPRATHPLFLIGRLAPGITVAQADQEVQQLAATLEQQYQENENRGALVEALPAVTFGPVRPVLVLLLAAVVLVLLVACVNVANLLLARSTRRAREIALRAALGAGLGRLGRQFMVETVLLSLGGAAVGVAVAYAGLDALLALVPAEVPRASEVGIDPRVLLVTLGVSLLVGVGFGLVPTLQSLRLDVMSHVKSEGAAGSGGPVRHRLRNALVVTEMALSVMLVLSAGLLIRSFARVMQVDPGFQAAGVLKAEYQLPATRYPVDYSRFPHWNEMQGFTRRLLERASSIPGVTRAAVAAQHPLNRGFTNSWGIVGRTTTERLPEISLRQVSPGYFETVGVRLSRGRVLEEGDGPDQPPVGVLNETAAQRFFPGEDPVGQSIRFWGITRRIVGVVADERIHGLTEETPPAVYVSLSQAPSQTGVLLLRTEGRPEDLAAQARDAVWSLDPGLAVFGVEPLETTLRTSVAQRRFAMLMLLLFAGVTLALALVGIYGVLSYATEQRVREIGIRKALGAGRAGVIGLIVRQGAVLAAAGVGLGLAGALFGSRLLQSLLFGVSRLDPFTHLVVPLAVMLAALGAMWVPAWRAARVSPMEALRME
ncbi:MAG TPA: ABC transporter permease [Gemmatimonadales bacterium]|nr:ABC transporter permease [Gemmatimonadales bacterium]